MLDWGSSDRGLERTVRKPHGGGMTMQMETNTPRAEELVALAASFAPVLREHAAAHDRDGTWVAEPYEALRQAGLLTLGVPSELGGMGASIAEIAAVDRELAKHCGSTALALSMHHHVTAFTAWRWRRGLPGAEATLKRVAGGETVLVSTGGGDFTHPKGTAVKVDGGWKVSGRKQFASQSPVGAVMSTMFTYDDPERGRRVLNLAVPFGEGVEIDRELGHARHARHGEQRRRGHRRLRARRQDPRRPSVRRRRPAAAGDLQHRLPDHQRRLPGRRRRRRRGGHRVGAGRVPTTRTCSARSACCATSCASPAGRRTVRSLPSATTRPRRWRRSPR